jgi:Core-2/I-Branching enzyme
MALAYLLICHRSADDVTTLLRAIYRPGNAYFLHADRKASPHLHDTLRGLADAFPNVQVLPSVLCSWGGWSQVETMLCGIAAACASPVPWRHLFLISESHLPVCSPEDAADALARGVSWLDAEPLSAMSADARDDVLHRFAAAHRELPGIGMFPVAARALPATFAHRLHHGSSWLTLARDACERFAALSSEHAIWAPFRGALQADEDALQTVLLGTDVGRGLTIARRNATFVAWPHLSGNADMTFTEQNFHAARAAGHLFIRKRPAVLPDSVAAILAAMQSSVPLPPTAVDRAPATPDAATLAAQLQTRLRALVAGVTIEVFPPDERAACCLHVVCAGLPERLLVAVLSQDLRTFKVALMWQAAWRGSFHITTLGGYPAVVLKVRLPSLFLAREVVLPSLPDSGFLSVDEDAAGHLSPLVAQALAAGIRFAPALAA